MAKFMFRVSTKYVGSEVEEEYEIPDEELEGLSEKDKDSVVYDHYQAWLYNDNIFVSWNEITDS